MPASRPRFGANRALEEPTTGLKNTTREASVAAAAGKATSLCAGHAQQFGGASPPANLMEVKA